MLRRRVLLKSEVRDARTGADGVRLDRRGFLGVTLGLMGADLLADSAELRAAPARHLVLVELAGGNDPWNTLIPVGEDAYYRARPSLAIPPGQALRLSEAQGLHPALAPLWPQWESGRWRSVAGVTFPGVDLTHFRSRQAWLRYWDVHVPRRSRKLTHRSGSMRERLPGDGYPDTPFGRDVRAAARSLLNEEGSVRRDLRLAGFDLHEDPGADGLHGMHSALLSQLAPGLRALEDDLRRHRLLSAVDIVVWSEFGRSLQENPGGGTGHAAGSLLLVAGNPALPGLG